MWLFGFGKKIDENIKSLMKINLKKRIPVIVCFKGVSKSIKNKIIYNGGKIKYEYTNANAIACEISPYGVDRLTELPEVSFVFIDHKAVLCLKNALAITGINSARTFNLTGKNIGIGVIDSGVYPHPDLTIQRNAIVYFKDLINNFDKPYDDNGHGTFTCGCISSSGYSSSKTYMGVAPDSNLCVVKAFDASGNGFISDIIKGIDLLIDEREKYNIRIMCIPFEFPYIKTIKANPLEEIIKKAIQNNIVVFAPSGNLGPQPYSIYFPGNMKDIITVGGISHGDKIHKNLSISIFSGRGPTSSGDTKPDIIAPCANITSLSSNTSYNPEFRVKTELQNPYTTKSGTSAACAIASGVAALILEKTPELSPADIKSILFISTTSLGENKFSQGKGIIDFEKIVK